MIFIDASEERSNSNMPSIEGAKTVSDLEAITGADFMLSLYGAPAATETLIRKHIERGALLVQRKSGLDLSASIFDGRMKMSLFKMMEMGAKQWQCILLFVGVMIPNKEGQAFINTQDARMKYWHVQAGISKWNGRGGTYENIVRKGLIPEWCNMKLRHLKEYAENPVKQVWPQEPVVMEEDELLQVLVPIKDGRITLATLPGLGPVGVQALWDEFKGDAASALCWLTTPPNKHSLKIKGIGPVTHKNAREWLGLDEVMAMGLNVDDDLLAYVEKDGMDE